MTTRSRDGFRHPRLLTSFDEVYAMLGGPKKICTLTGKSRASVWNWRKAQQFPAKHYKVMRDVLYDQGCVADLRVWDFERAPITDDVAA